MKHTFYFTLIALTLNITSVFACDDLIGKYICDLEGGQSSVEVTKSGDSYKASTAIVGMEKLLGYTNFKLACNGNGELTGQVKDLFITEKIKLSYEQGGIAQETRVFGMTKEMENPAIVFCQRVK